MSVVCKQRWTVTPIADLRPTQVTVGLREVAIKRARWRELVASSGEGCQQRIANSKKCSPVVVGPQKRFYLIDGHHRARALYEEGVKEISVKIVEDLSALDSADFWALLNHRNWTYPFGAHGQRYALTDMPKTLMSLIEDPFRSLANELKRRGTYTKDRTPFSECRWADFLRGKIDRSLLECDFGGAILIAQEFVARRV